MCVCVCVCVCVFVRRQLLRWEGWHDARARAARRSEAVARQQEAPPGGGPTVPTDKTPRCSLLGLALRTAAPMYTCCPKTRLAAAWQPPTTRHKHSCVPAALRSKPDTPSHHAHHAQVEPGLGPQKLGMGAPKER